MRGLSATDVERLSGGAINLSQLSRLENGKSNWQPYHLEAMAKALGISVRELMPSDEEISGEAQPEEAAEGAAARPDKIEDDDEILKALKDSIELTRESLAVTKQLAEALEKRKA